VAIERRRKSEKGERRRQGRDRRRGSKEREAEAERHSNEWEAAEGMDRIQAEGTEGRDRGKGRATCVRKSQPARVRVSW
jgi:hypothetical protein